MKTRSLFFEILQNEPGIFDEIRTYGQSGIIVISDKLEEVYTDNRLINELGFRKESTFLTKNKALLDSLQRDVFLQSKNIISLKNAKGDTQKLNAHKVITKTQNIRICILMLDDLPDNQFSFSTYQNDEDVVHNLLEWLKNDELGLKKNQYDKIRSSIKRLVDTVNSYDSINNNIPGAVLRYKINADYSDELLYISEGVNQVWGLTVSEAMKNVAKLWEPVVPEDLSGMQNSIIQSGEKLTEWDHMWRIRQKGRVKWLHGRGVPKKQKDGGVEWDTLILDITAIKEYEKALKESEDKINKLVKNVPGVVFQFEAFMNGESRFAYLSEQFKLLHPEVDYNNVLDDPSIAFGTVHADYLPHLMSLIQKGFHSSEPIDFTYRVKSKEVIWHNIIATPEKMESRVAWYGIIRDVTHEIKSRQEIELLANTARHSSDILLTVENDGRISWSNDVVHEEFNAGNGKLTDLRLDELLLKNNISKEELPAILKSFKGKKSYENILPFSGSEEKKWFNFNIKPVYDNDKKVYNIARLANITHVIERQLALQQLLDETAEQRNRFQQYAYITSHNIRSNVARIIGLVKLIKSEKENADYLNMLDDCAEMLDTTLSNISELITMEKEFSSPTYKPYSLKEACIRQVDMLRTTIRQKEVKIDLQLDDIVLHTMPAYIDSILNNLLTNALKYGVTPTSNKIKVVLKKKNDKKVVLIVQDYGRGIDVEKYRDRLFKIGSRLHEVSTGNGLGLYLVHRQASTIGADIDLKSKPNEGAKFTVTFPVVNPENL